MEGGVEEERSELEWRDSEEREGGEGEGWERDRGKQRGRQE